MKRNKRKYRSLKDKLSWRTDSSQRPKDYPLRPLSKKNAMLRPIKRS